MSRLSFVLVALVGMLAGGLGVSLLRPQPATLGDSDVRAVVAQMLQQDKASASTPGIDKAAIGQVIEDYLLSDPTILQRANEKLAEQQQVAQRKAEKDSIDAHSAQIYQGADDVVLGNPRGDVTLVEMFDYNCVYCRQALPDMAQLIADDPNLKIILKQFPILSSGSVDAARIAVLVSENPKINYWDFHQKLFSMRAGSVGADQALQVAQAVGGDRVELMLDMNSKHTADVVQQSYDLAKALGISGTPTYILGDEVIPGAMDVDRLRAKIANVRACGSTDCPAAGTSPTG